MAIEQANGWFYTQAIENPAKTRKKGRPVFDDTVMCEITIPGDRLNKVVQIANDEHKTRFPAAWKQYEAMKEQVGEGTPLEQWSLMTAGRVMELKSLHIHTVEQLADLNESFITKLGIDGRRLVEDAQAYIKTAEDGPAKVAAENADLKRRVEVLEGMIKDGGDGSDLATENSNLKARIAELEAAATAQPETTVSADNKGENGDADNKAEEKAEKQRLKAMIKEKTGETVAGNPSLKTLKKMIEGLQED